MIRSTMFAGLVVLTLCLPGRADIPPATESELREEATHIVQGKIGRIYQTTEVKGNFRHTYKVAAVTVRSVAKGAGIERGELLYVRYWHKEWLPKTPPRPGFYGHTGVPTCGDSIHVYLKRAGDKGYDVLVPNGFSVSKP